MGEQASPVVPCSKGPFNSNSIDTEEVRVKEEIGDCEGEPQDFSDLLGISTVSSVLRS